MEMSIWSTMGFQWFPQELEMALALFWTLHFHSLQIEPGPILPHTPSISNLNYRPSILLLATFWRKAFFHFLNKGKYETSNHSDHLCYLICQDRRNDGNQHIDDVHENIADEKWLIFVNQIVIWFMLVIVRDTVGAVTRWCFNKINAAKILKLLGFVPSILYLITQSAGIDCIGRWNDRLLQAALSSCQQN